MLSPSSIRVIDGDTMRVWPYGSIRLVGFNAPESRRDKARCAGEMEAGRRSARRLRGLLESSEALALALVTCACRPRTQGTPRCNFGRACGRLAVDGRDVAETLIAEGLAVPYACGATRCPRRSAARWCGTST